jgi:hypothetical protein
MYFLSTESRLALEAAIKAIPQKVITRNHGHCFMQESLVLFLYRYGTNNLYRVTVPEGMKVHFPDQTSVWAHSKSKNKSPYGRELYTVGGDDDPFQVNYNPIRANKFKFTWKVANSEPELFIVPGPPDTP